MTDATRKEVLQSLLCCHADLCRMEGRTKDCEHDIVFSVARAVSRAILNLVEPEEEDRDPYNTGMHDEYDLDENGHIKAIHTCENEPKPEPNLTYAFKEFLRRQISVHKMCKAQGGGKNPICHYCTITDYCDSSVREVCRELQKEAAPVEENPEPTPPPETNYERWMRTKYRRDFQPVPGRYYDCGNCPASSFSFKKPLGEEGRGCFNCFFWWGNAPAEDEQWKGKD